MKCEIKYKGKDYSFEEYIELLNSGEIDALIRDGVLDRNELKGEIEAAQEPRSQTEPVQEAAVQETGALKDVESTAKALEGIYKKQNPHSGGGLSGDAKGFDELPEDSEVFVYTATTPENAKAILSGDKDYTPQKQGQGIKGESNKIYVASDPRVVSGLGKTIIGFKIRKSDLELSPEAKKSNQTLGRAVITSGTGALLKGEPLLKFIAENQERINTSAKSGNEAISEAYHKAKSDGSNPELVKAVEELLGKPKETPVSKTDEKIDTSKQDSQDKPDKEDTKPKSKARQKAEELRKKAQALRDATGGAAMVAPKLVAAAYDAYATLLEKYDDAVKAFSEFKKTKEYKALGDEDRAMIDLELEERPKNLKTVAQSFMDSDMDDDQKRKLAERADNELEVTGLDELQTKAKEIIEGLGGIENAVIEVEKAGNVIPDRFKTVVYGEAMLYAQKKQREAKTEAEKDKWADAEIDYQTKLANVAYSFGLANAYIAKIYQDSPYSLVRRTKKAMDERNALLAPSKKVITDTVNEILDNKEDLTAAIEQAVQEAVERTNAERDQKIKELQDKIDKFKRFQTTGKVRKDYKVTTEEKNKAFEAIKRLRSKPGGLVLLNSSVMNPELYKNLGIIARYYVERGYTKFEDFYKKMKGEVIDFEEAYEKLYREARDLAIENGIPAKEFTGDLEVERQAAEFYELVERLEAEKERLKAEKKEHQKFSKAGIDKLIKETFIEAGFGKEINTKTGKKTVVDWQKVTTDAKNVKDTVDKIREQLKGKIPQDLVDSLANTIEQRAETLVGEKKVQAIENATRRYRATRVLNTLKRRTRIQSLVDTWKQGGLTNRDIIDKMGRDFNFATFTKENADWVEAKIEEIDKAQEGAEKERLEEQLQAYLEDLSAPLMSIKRILERTKARLLSAPVTFIKNAFGAVDAQLATIHKALIAQVANLKEGTLDTEILKIVVRSHAKAAFTAFDVLLNGGVDTGIALSERTKTKEGSPAVRYMENPRLGIFKPQFVTVGGKKVNVNPLNWEKYPQRAMAAADAFAQIMLQEVGTYSFIKNDLMSKNPNMSAKEASRKAYEIAYSVEIADAMKQADKEFKARGIDLKAENNEILGAAKNRARFMRRVHEIVEQKRNDIAIKAGQKFGNRYTYKEYDWGVFSGVGYGMAQFKQVGNNISAALYRAAKERKSVTLYRAAQLSEAVWLTTFDFFIPFVKSLGNIAEKGFEFTAYGYGKAATYGAAALYNRVKRGKDAEPNFERASEYLFRANMGALFMLLLLGLADEDEEGKEKLYGEGSDDWRERNMRGQQRPVNTIVIGGRNISLDLLGPFAIKARLEAAKLDAERYETQSAIGLSLANSVLSDAYFEKLGKTVGALKTLAGKGDDEKFSKLMQKEAAEYMTRLVFPFTQASRQTYQMLNPNQKLPLTFGDQVAKNSGIYFGWALKRYAFDYRGREIESGNLYTSGADGVLKSFKKAQGIDAVDAFVMKYKPNLTQIEKTDDNLTIQDETGEFVPIGDVAFTTVKYNAAKRFDSLITNFAKNPAIEPPAINFETKEFEQVMKETAKEMGRDISGNQYTTDPEVRKRAAEKYVEQKNFDKMSDTVGELYKISKNAAILDYLQSVGEYVPVSLLDAKEKYDRYLNFYQERANN